MIQEVRKGGRGGLRKGTRMEKYDQEEEEHPTRERSMSERRFKRKGKEG